MGDNMLIGIICRLDKNKTSKDVYIIYSSIIKKLRELNCNVIGILPDKDYKKTIDLCDGIILQGGSDFSKYDLDIVKYLYEIDKPTLGICLGMQLMGVFLDGELTLIDNHDNTNHDVIINNNSILYDKSNIVNVNSRHKYVLKNTNAKVIGRDLHGNIEAITDDTKKFFVGVQWHPEDIFDNTFIKFIEKVGECN